jgi:hypothetical protein
VNGEVRQQDSTERLMFLFDFLIAYLSTFATLKPGDMIATGTPTGAGARSDPPRWLKPGDVVEVESSRIGVLRNTVVAEEWPGGMKSGNRRGRPGRRQLPRSCATEAAGLRSSDAKSACRSRGEPRLEYPHGQNIQSR